MTEPSKPAKPQPQSAPVADDRAPSTSVRARPQKTVPVADVEALTNSVRQRLAARRPFIVLLAGPNVGARHRIEGACTVGRDEGADLVLRDHLASKLHARFEVRGPDVFVVDMGSTNGTLVNERRVDEARLYPGDKVFVGSTVMRFEWQDAVEDEYHDEIERLLSVDELTGLMSKRRFDAEAVTRVDTALRAEQPVGVLMMDLDGIKRINDTHGHAFGAYTIAEAGALIGRVVGPRGIVTRWGGDEYAAVLPGLPLGEAVAVGEELVAAIGAHCFEREGVRLAPGISIGAASGPAQGTTHDVLQHQADEALYRAKRAGKNRVST